MLLLFGKKISRHYLRGRNFCDKLFLHQFDRLLSAMKQQTIPNVGRVNTTVLIWLINITTISNAAEMNLSNNIFKRLLKS